MGVGQNLNMLEARLLLLGGKIRQVHLDALGSGKAPGSGSQDPSLAARLGRLGQKLAPIQVEMEQIAEMLARIAHELDGRERIAWHVGREHRYRALQSVRSHARRQQEVYQLLQDIILDLQDLVRASGDLTTADLIGLGNKLKGQMTEFAQHVQEAKAMLVQPSTPAFVPATQTVNVGWSTLLMMAYVLVLALRERARRKGGE
jgi:hypothetical protein